MHNLLRIITRCQLSYAKYFYEIWHHIFVHEHFLLQVFFVVVSMFFKRWTFSRGIVWNVFLGNMTWSVFSRAWNIYEIFLTFVLYDMNIRDPVITKSRTVIFNGEVPDYFIWRRFFVLWYICSRKNTFFYFFICVCIYIELKFVISPVFYICVLGLRRFGRKIILKPF